MGRIGILDSLQDLHKFALGFDRAFNALEFASNIPRPGYPPYNIRKVNDTGFMVEIAVAGFKKDELDITVADGRLTVTGNKQVETGKEYLYKGIADRTFIRDYQIADTIVVQNASILDGVLYIYLENIVPDEKKPKKIEISNDPVATKNVELLLEQAEQYPSKKLAEETAEKL